MSTLIKNKYGKMIRFEETAGIQETIVNFITDGEHLEEIQGSILYHGGDAYSLERLLIPAGAKKDMENSDFDKYKL